MANFTMNLNNPLFPLEYFPTRVSTRKVSAKVMPKGGAAAGGINPKTGEAFIPIELNAYSRNVRRHEALHGIYSTGKVDMTAMGQGLEDMRIHLLGINGINPQARRDELVCATKDLRTLAKHLPEIKKNCKIDGGRNVRVNLIPLVRAMAILDAGYDSKRVANLVSKLVSEFEGMIGRKGLRNAVQSAIDAIKASDDMSAAKKALRPFMTMPKGEQLKPQQPNGPQSQKQQQSKQNSKQSQPPMSPPPVEDENDEENGESGENGESKQDSKQSKESKESDSKDSKQNKTNDKKESKQSKNDSEDSEEETEDEDGENANNSSENDSESENEDEDGEESENASESDSDAGNDTSDEDEEMESEDEPNHSGDTGENSEDETEEEYEGEDVEAEESFKEEMSGSAIGGAGDLTLEKALVGNIISPESVSLLPLEEIEAVLAAGNSSYAHSNMPIHKLEFSLSKRITEGKNDKPMMCGAKIRAKRLCGAVSPNPGRLFLRRGKREGGTVVIDASGSMALDNERLARLAERLPIGQIAYYSNQGLVIYAQNRRSYCLPKGGCLPHHGGGNTYDFQALQWILKQPGPRWFISDLMFCGNHQAFEQAGFKLARVAHDRKLITFMATLGELEVKLGLELEINERDKAFSERAQEYMQLVLGTHSTKTFCFACGGNGFVYTPDYSKYERCTACNGRGKYAKV